MKALLAAVAAPETLEDLEGAAAVETTARTLTSLNRIPGEPKALSPLAFGMSISVCWIYNQLKNTEGISCQKDTLLPAISTANAIEVCPSCFPLYRQTNLIVPYYEA